MPMRPGKPCNYPGCPEVVHDTYCDTHRKQKRRYASRNRESSTARGYGYRWQQVRLNYLRRHPLCILCEEEGKATAANVVDHIKPHKGNTSLMWDEGNFQPLCKHHHDVKTATEDGGFGR